VSTKVPHHLKIKREQKPKGLKTKIEQKPKGQNQKAKKSNWLKSKRPKN
jgi:hypothetical protein